MKIEKSKILVKKFSKIFLKRNFFLHEPDISNREIKEVENCLKINQVSSSGIYTKKFENKLKKYTKSKFVIPVSSGTAGLHLSLIALSIKKNEEILIPNLNYIAVANAALYVGAIPHFIDVRKSDLGIDCDKLNNYLLDNTKLKKKECININTGRKIKAIVSMHTFGLVSDISNINKIAKKFHLKTIEDAAEGLGAFYKRRHVGTFGVIGILSFNGNKIVTSGAGGALLTSDNKIASRLRHLSQICKISHPWNYDYDDLGYNYKMPSLNAALGYAQLQRINYFLKEKRKLFNLYLKIFSNNKYAKLIKENIDTKSNYWLITILLNEDLKKNKEQIIKLLHGKKIMVRPAWKLLNKISYLKKFPRMNLSNSVNLFERIINLPSSSNVFMKLKNRNE